MPVDHDILLKQLKDWVGMSAMVLDKVKNRDFFVGIGDFHQR